MSKLLVTAAHLRGPLENGADGCHARWADDGMCPGLERAEWLNGLGEDQAPYGSGATGLTNLDVRLNWLRGNHHVVAVDSTLEALRREERNLQKELDGTRKRIREVTSAPIRRQPSQRPRP